MAVRIKVRRELGGAGSVPTTSNLEAYEIAQNTADKRLFGRDGSNAIFEFGINPTSITTGAITASGTVTANSSLVSSNATFTGGSINGMVIGASSAAAITATTVNGTVITASTNFSGNLTGNVTGNIAGNVTGNITGSGSSTLTTLAATNFTAGGLTYPTSDGAANTVLATNGSGALSFISVSGAFDLASQSEAEAGTETAGRIFSPLRVKQAIDALALSNIISDTTPQLGGDLDGQGKDITDVGVLTKDTAAPIYGSSSSPIVLTVTVASKTAAHAYNGDGSSNGYFINGIEAPAIEFGGSDAVTANTEYVYKFDQSDSSNSGHPLVFYLESAKNTAYTTGVTTSGTPGSSGAYTQIAVDSETPKILYYQCSSHAYMGNYAVVPASLSFSAGTLRVAGTAVTASGAELNYVDGVTSNIQTQLNAKQAADANLTSFLSALNLPTSDGTNGQAIVTNGSGTLSFGDSGKVFGTPTNTSPAQGATAQILTPTLTASAFINLDGLTMAAAQWQISTASDFSSTVLSTGDVAGTSTSYTVGSSDVLVAETVHYWRVRYKDSAGNYSDYSTGTSFTTGAAAGQQAYTSAGTFSWTAPAGVSSVCVVVVGAGGSGRKDHDSCGGGGGALAYKNNITVSPGSSYTVGVGSPGASRTSAQDGQDGGDSYFINTNILYAQGGRKGTQNSTANTSGKVGDGGGEGGGSTDNRGGACGAAGYSGNGGDSKYSNTTPDAAPNGGGGSAAYNFDQQGSHGGGGVGILGEGSSGAAPGTSTSNGNGQGGSSGADGGFAVSGGSYFTSGTKGDGGDYGGGGGRGTTSSSYNTHSGAGGKGAVRIIWGTGRSFPSTNTADQ